MATATHFAVNPSTGERLALIGGEWVSATNQSTGTVGGAPKLTEDQGKAQGWTRLQQDAETSYQRARDEGYNPGSLRNAAAGVVEGLPWHMGEGASDLIRDDRGDRGHQAELLWTDSQLRALSGANAPEPEARRNYRTYFPGPGDGSGDQKTESRRTAFEANKLRSGPAGPAIGGYVEGGKRVTKDVLAGFTEPQRAAAKRYAGVVGTPGTAKNPFIAGDAEYDGLPSKAYFIAPDGSLRRKP